MTADTNDVQVLGQVLYAHAAESAGEHPEIDTLADYSGGRLDAEAEAKVRGHLVGCTSCTETYLDLDTLARPEIPREGVADLATAAAWRETRGALFTPESAAPPRTGWQWSHAVAAAALVPIIGLSAWVAQLSGTASDLRIRVAELTQPQANVPIVYFGEVLRSAGEEIIEVPAGVSHFPAIFNSPELGDFERYDVRFFDPEGAIILSVDGLVLSESLTLRVGLVRGNPPTGEYRVEVRGFDGREWQPVEEYRRRIVYLEP